MSTETDTSVFEISFTPPEKGAAGLSEFIVGEENFLAQAAVDSLLKGRPESYQPIVLYSIPGCGKSHLAEGLARTWRAEKSQPFYSTTGADFARGFARAIETKSVAEFREKHVSAKLLIIDDLHDMGTKTAAQHEIANTIDSVLDAGGSVLVTLDQSPATHPQLESRLASRLSQGLAIPLFPPGEAARKRIIRRLIEEHDFSMTAAALDLLAEQANRTTPELRGIVLRLAEESGSNSISLTAVRNFLDGQNRRKGPTLRTIAARVSGIFKVKSADLKGKTRRRTVVRARGVAMFLARQLTSKSLQQVGAHFGGRDHTTVMHAVRKTESLLKTDNEIRQHVEELIRQLK